MSHSSSSPSTTERQESSENSLVPAKKRIGDSVFKGLSTGSGVLILVVLALVALFLIMQALPALTTSPDLLMQQGYGPFWSWVIPIAFGTVYSSFLALLFAVPVGMGIALFISHYAPRQLAQPLGYVIDLLAAVPSVVFGLWGANAFAPSVNTAWIWLNRNMGWFPPFGGQASGTGRTMLTASLVLAVMILPIITSLCREVFLQAPKLHEEAALALGATRWEMIRMSVLPFARAGIISAVMLALGRALGETMAVAMILSGANVINWQVLTGTNSNTIAATIALNFPEAFGLRVNQLIAGGLVLFVITLAVNMLARWVVSRRAAFSGAN
ncbi:phosphate ABC transporter permease subunit PstC [Nigerium massiliense]|uniref:phosphate ABC transporter permease subunit PstC n=1 Tax=Nigerium massiliense TaxID=1522317 RepID=UPI00058D0F7A|nr:phosphate ABC transporter permease subunit PstC [Nigerium massiliense]